MINKSIILTITGILLTITGIWDGYKYHWAAQAIRKTQTAKGQSRKFINAAIVNDLVRIIHCLLIFDWWLVASSLFAIIFMLEHWWCVYKFYPYKFRNLLNWKRPPLWIYIINSLIPNKYRKRL